jgi:nucleotide-binding universal stress UspA family protein
MKKILVPLDGSALADRAIPFVTTLASRARCDVVLVRAVNTLSVYSERACAASGARRRSALGASSPSRYRGWRDAVPVAARHSWRRCERSGSPSVAAPALAWGAV